MLFICFVMRCKMLKFELIKLIQMNISFEINKIKHDLEELHDEKLIETVKTLLDFARKNRFEAGLRPMSVEEYKQRALKSESDIENGRVTDVNDL